MNTLDPTNWRMNPAFDNEEEAAACLAAVEDCLRAMSVELQPSDEPYPLSGLPARPA